MPIKSRVGGIFLLLNFKKYPTLRCTDMKKIIQLHFLTACVALGSMLVAWGQNPTPAKNQTRAVVLQGGTAHLGNGQVIENALVRFEAGKITYVGRQQDAVGLGDAEVINTTGKHIYPGLIAPYNQIGLTEIDAVRATVDHTEAGPINPHVRALVAYNTDSEIIPTVRSNGVLLTQSTPQGSLVPGQSAVMELDGWNWEDAVLKADDGIHLNWPPYMSQQFDFENFRITLKKNEKRNETIQEMTRLFDDAQAYYAAVSPVRNTKLDAMKGLFDGTKILYIAADYGKEIVEGVQFAQRKGVKKITVISAEEALMVTDFLKTNNIPVIVSSTHRLPNKPDDDYDLPYKLPGLLHKAGVQTSIGYLGMSWRTRNLPFLAGTAVAYGGITSEEAVQMLTLNTARALGIESQVGSIEVGKLATLVVSAGDILDMRTARVEQAFIRGRKIDLDDKHKRLYRRFQEKYQR
jgi:imidazolonepropionase-like amidohydrolase